MSTILVATYFTLNQTYPEQNQRLSPDRPLKLPFKNVKRLYGVRSKIVHSGSHEIDLHDLDTMRKYTKRVVLKMLKDVTVRMFTKPQEFDEWLDERAFA